MNCLILNNAFLLKLCIWFIYIQHFFVLNIWWCFCIAQIRKKASTKVSEYIDIIYPNWCWGPLKPVVISFNLTATWNQWEHQTENVGGHELRVKEKRRRQKRKSRKQRGKAGVKKETLKQSKNSFRKNKRGQNTNNYMEQLVSKAFIAPA